MQFIGRGQNLANAIALSEGAHLSNSSGATLDPVLCLRIKIQVAEKSKVQVAFTTGLATSRQEALELADRYHDIHSFERECKIAWTKAQVDMRHLNIDPKTAYLCQRLAERILFTEPSLRVPSHQRAANLNVQSSLWPLGISGDLPIVVMRISDQRDLSNVRKLLRCHEYLRLKGLIYDFVIINEHETTYFQGLQSELQQQIRCTGSQGWLNKSGGIFILRRDITPENDIANIQAVARVSLLANEPLNDQIRRKPLGEKYPDRLAFNSSKISFNRDKEWDLAKQYQEFSTEYPLDFSNGFGGFSKNGREYVIILKPDEWTPAPWLNVIGNKVDFGFQISEAGSSFTWGKNSQTNRLTPWSNDPVCDPSGEVIYLRDDETGEVWTPTPLPIRTNTTYTIRHGQGYTIFEQSSYGLQHSLTVFAAKDEPIKISILKIKNLTKRNRKITLSSYTEWVLGSQREKTAPYLVCNVDPESSAIFARNPHDNEFSSLVAFADISTSQRTFTCSRKEFIGRNGNYEKPAALERNGLSRRRGTGQDPCAVLQTTVELVPDEEQEFSFLIGQCENINAARKLSLRYRDLHLAKKALADVVEYWNQLLNTVQIKTPDSAMNILMNSWLLYQTLSCRYLSRTAFYQSGGAYGFRDQLQDCMAFIYSAPNITREHILRASERQFKEGDVQHWWHPPSGRGIRTRMSDDLLWLPYVVSFYVRVSGDKTLLEERTHFLEAPILKPEEEESYGLPKVSRESATVFEHCLLAIDRSLLFGFHDLPLIGTGDWNDGMNKVGFGGKGESIWLGWFLYKVLADFSLLCDQPAHALIRKKYEEYMQRIQRAIEKEAWDGDWYRRAYYDDGTPLGSTSNDECRIDSISQSWSVLSGAGNLKRSQQALNKVMELLVQKKSKLIMLLTPPFDKTPNDPGYIKGYVPGVRENGGQYTHAAIWVIMAYAELKEGNYAFELYQMLNPILHSENKSESHKYKIEPYVIAADVYAGGLLEGRGGWSWYTGSSSWYYRAGLESLLGFKLEGKKLKIVPCIPNHWKSYEVHYTYRSSKYLIQVNNPMGLNSGPVIIQRDGFPVQSSEIDLEDDGKIHKLIATITTPTVAAFPTATTITAATTIEPSQQEKIGPLPYSDQSKI
jgi:cyclic beta-1,2-glucan synthetase